MKSAIMKGLLGVARWLHDYLLLPRRLEELKGRVDAMERAGIERVESKIDEVLAHLRGTGRPTKPDEEKPKPKE